MGGVVALLIIVGFVLIFWRRRKHKQERDELEYENQVRNEFGRRLELEFDDDDDEHGTRQEVRPLSLQVFYLSCY